MKNLFTQMLLVLLLIPFMAAVSQTLPRKSAQPTVCLSGQEFHKTVIPADGTRSLITEDFTGGCPPSGWTVVGDGQDNWQSSDSDNAGGVAPEAMFNWNPNFVGNSKMASPALNTTGMTDVVLGFRQMVSDYSGGYSISVETSSDGTNWTPVWTEEITGSIDAEVVDILISNDDVGSDQFMFAFVFEGDSYDINQWYIDDVSLSEAYGNDAGMASLYFQPLAGENDMVEFQSVVKNYGTETISFDVTIEIKEGSNVIYTHTGTVTNLEALQTQEVVFDGWAAQIGTYDVEVSTMLAGDEQPGNDMMSGSIQVITNTVAKKPLFEEFTSSTCAPCASANPIIDQVLEDNPDEYSLIKYQMNWPGAGDPYYTEQGGVRRDYYSISAVPTLYGNAVQINPANTMSQEIFDNLAGDLTGLEITVDATMDQDNQISVEANVTSYADYPAGMKLQIAIVEKTTYGNVTTNGENEFSHVMMAMMPGPEGTGLDALSPGSEVTVTETYDMSTTFMEQPNDLAVVVFVQDDSDKQVIQSEMADVTGDFVTYSVTFNVKDSNGDDVEDAEIDFDINGPMQTGANGQAVYQEVFAGNWDYEVAKSGLIPSSGQVEVIDQDVEVDVVLEVPEFFFFEDFNDGLPGDWTKYISSGNSNNLYWYDGFIVFWMQSAGDEDIILIAPEMNLSQAGTLFFDAGDTYLTPGISVGTVASPDDPDSFQELETIQLESAMTEYAVVLEDYSITDTYLAFKYSGPAQGYFYFDNVKITVSSTALPVPTGLTATVTDNDVNLQWTAPATDDFIEYKIYRDGDYLASTEDTNYDDPDLENGLYDYYVTAVFDDGESGPSNIVTANVGNVPVYCDAWGGCDQYFSIVQLGSIDNTSGCTEYGDYTDMSTQLVPGETYTLSLVVSSPSSGDDIGIWIDFNQDGEFGEEENLVCEMNNSQGVFDFDITVPEDAELGMTRMRLRVKYWEDGCEPCGSSTWGETEDYSVEITDPSGLSEPQLTDIQLFPNPVTTQLSVTSPDPIERLWIYDYSGKLVFQSFEMTREMTIDLSDNAPGLYLCRMLTANGITARQVVIQ